MRFHAVLLVSAASFTAACGAKTSDGAATDSAVTSAPATASASPTVVTIIAKDFSYDAPDTISAGMVTLRLVNQGPDLHHVSLFKLDDGHTVAEFETAFKQMKPGAPLPTWLHDVAGPNTPVPGGEQSVTEELAAGNYVMVCFIPGADQIPHVMKGMVKGLTVIPATTASAPAPVADISVRMRDYAWEVTPAITAGKHVLRIENDAEQPHEMFIMQLAPGKTTADAMAWVEKPVGPPPGKPIGGISGMSKGGVVYVPVDFAPGEYGLFCFVPDAKDGKMHSAHGMVTQLAVK